MNKSWIKEQWQISCCERRSLQSLCPPPGGQLSGGPFYRSLLWPRGAHREPYLLDDLGLAKMAIAEMHW